MWTPLLCAVVLSLGVGCTTSVTIAPLATDDLGPAAVCEWRQHQPYNCVYDPTRYTIDRDYFRDMLNELQHYYEDEFNRRKL